MNLTFIKKDLDEVLNLNSNEFFKDKIKNKFGNDYTVIGVEPIVIQHISEIIVDNMESLSISDRAKLIKDFVTSKIFEEVWLGYTVWKNAKKSYLGLKKTDIIDLRPKTIGLFNHLYATSILPPYIRIGKFNQDTLFQLLNNKKVPDQLISLRAFLVISKKSTRFRKFSSLMLEDRNWINNSEITNLLSHLHNHKRYSVKPKKRSQTYTFV